jgi:hypothetical protein
MTSWPLGILVAALFSAPAGQGATVPASDASAAPSAAPSDSAEREQKLAPLKEIGRVKATTAFCQAIIDHAAKAVTLGIDNDRKIENVVRTLRTADLDSNELSKNRALLDLANQNAPLSEQAIAAEKAAKALRVDAAKAPTPEEAKELLAFADALDGALHRQRTIARDLGGTIAFFGAHPSVTKEERDEAVFEEQQSEGNRFGPWLFPIERAAPPDGRVMPLLSDLAKDSADDFVVRLDGVRHDELSAAELVEPVFGGC